MVVLKINGVSHWLWRAIDATGDVLDILVRPRRDTTGARPFMRKLFQRWGLPRLMVTDKLGSYPIAKARLAPRVAHRRHKGVNNSTEALHRHTRQREKIMGRVKSPGNAQQFLSVHDQTAAIFRLRRHRLSARSYRHARQDGSDLWAAYTTELSARTVVGGSLPVQANNLTVPPRQAQRFLSVHDQTAALFHPMRHRIPAISYRNARSDAFALWFDYASDLRA